MKTLATTLILSFLLFSQAVFAGSKHEHGHSHAQAPVSQEIAEKNANEVIASLIERDKIDKIWATIKASSVDKKVLNGNPEWVVIYDSKKITDADKQKLYVFLTVEGDYIAANYTGN